KFFSFKMIKWFVYIVFSFILIPCIAAVKINPHSNKSFYRKSNVYTDIDRVVALADTTPKSKQKQQESDKKIKEVTKAKQVPKPEKIDDSQQKAKPKRQRRPPGMERPPEIPRRNGN
ncbi:MAG TPA: hypothetical protein VJ844_03470, partial [Mucilaginibacter sp.]|nr:hypothetical protein [Mucilaginibacter sp.]